MNSSAPCFPTLHHLLELAQTHVHWITDAIQPSHPLSSPSPPALNLSQHHLLKRFFFPHWMVLAPSCFLVDTILSIPLCGRITSHYSSGPFTFDQFSSVQSLSHVQLFSTPWTTACQASLSITNSQSLLKLMSIESVIPSNHLILCCPLLLLPSVFPSIRVFSNESARCIRWPKYWSFSFNISPSNEHPGLISFRMDWLDLLLVQGFSRAFSNTTVQKHQFFGAQLSL